MVSDADIVKVSSQLGRPARGIVEIAARCVCGNPLVVKTRPRLDDGTPFPTLYYLTHPRATAAVSTLESVGLMVELGKLLEEEIMAANYLAAHESYLVERDQLEQVTALAGISAGGMPTRVKCLHALVAHALAKGPGVNVIGDIALEQCSWSPLVCECEFGNDSPAIR